MKHDSRRTGGLSRLPKNPIESRHCVSTYLHQDIVFTAFDTSPIPVSSKQSQISTKISLTPLAQLCPVSEAKNLHLKPSKQPHR